MPVSARMVVVFVCLMPDFLCSCRHTQRENVSIPLQKGWKMKLGDERSWASPSFNDSLWDVVRVGGQSGPVAFDKYDGFGWYRVKVFIPSSLKKAPHLSDSVKIFLGKIDDCDQVYLNGRLLGQNTIVLSDTVPGQDFTKVYNLWQKDRKYIISVDDPRLLWDTINVIAIRVFDQQGGGGLYGRNPYIGMVDLEDYVTFDMSRFYKVMNQDSVDKRFLVKNNSPHFMYAGELTITAQRAGVSAVDLDQEENLRLGPGDSVFVSVALPVSTDPIRVLVRFSDKQRDLSACDSVEVPYALSRNN